MELLSKSSDLSLKGTNSHKCRLFWQIVFFLFWKPRLANKYLRGLNHELRSTELVITCASVPAKRFERSIVRTTAIP